MTASPPDPYIAGFHDGLGAAAQCCTDFADEVDVRKEAQRTAVLRSHHRNPSPEVRRLRQAASRIRDIEPPSGKTAHA